ncbi:putative ribonuclease H-like domain-containing protein [Tanacetum coccineum]
MDIFTKGALWDYWKMGGDEIEVSNDESSDLEEYWSGPNLLTKDIIRFKTYEDYKDDWIYEWNENVPWDGYCNGGNFPGAYVIGNSLHYQDLECNDESSNDCWKRWKIHKIYYHDYDEGEYENETHEEGHELCDYYSEDQYAVSIKEDTTYPCLHSPKTTKEKRSIRRILKKSIRHIEDIVCEYSGRYQTWSLLQETPIRHILIDKTLFIKKDIGDILLVQVYVDDIIFGSTKKSLCIKFEKMMHKRFQMSSIGELTFFLGLQATSTLIETNKALNKDEEAEDVDVHLYRSMIGSLIYLIASRPNLMFAVCACARFQVTPKTSHLHVVKMIFKYLKGQPKLGLWYPRDSPFDLEAFSNSDYAGASLDRKSTTGGCQFLGKRLISWQCKKQTIVANSTTEAEYVAVANCCGQNPVFHSKTKHIEIRHHFIRDSYEKKLIQVIKIHTDHNVADLLTKAFDVSRELIQVVVAGAKIPYWGVQKLKLVLSRPMGYSISKDPKEEPIEEELLGVTRGIGWSLVRECREAGLRSSYRYARVGLDP